MENVINVHDIAKQAKRRLRGTNVQTKEQDTSVITAVREMADTPFPVLNPLGRLTDEKVFSALDNSGKQRYILQLSARYNECLERIKSSAV